MVVGWANVVFGKKSLKWIFIVLKFSTVGLKVTSNNSVFLMLFEFAATVFVSIVVISWVPDVGNIEKSVWFSDALVWDLHQIIETKEKFSICQNLCL